jgi:hypothetical protein
MLFTFACEAAGALGARHSLRPLWAKLHARLGRIAPRECGRVSGHGCLKKLNREVRECALPLPLWERSDRLDNVETIRVRGPGLSMDRNPTPTVSHRSRIYPTSTNMMPTRVNPSWVGEGAHRRCRDSEVYFSADEHRSQKKGRSVWVPAPVRNCALGRDDDERTPRRERPYSGAALSPRALESLEANDATTITQAISPITSVQMALISGFTPSRTSE